MQLKSGKNVLKKGLQRQRKHLDLGEAGGKHKKKIIIKLKISFYFVLRNRQQKQDTKSLFCNTLQFNHLCKENLVLFQKKFNVIYN